MPPIQQTRPSAGTFRPPGEVAGVSGVARGSVGVWVSGGLVVLGECLVLAEVATRRARWGGGFVFVAHG